MISPRSPLSAAPSAIVGEERVGEGGPLGQAQLALVDLPGEREGNAQRAGHQLEGPVGRPRHIRLRHAHRAAERQAPPGKRRERRPRRGVRVSFEQQPQAKVADPSVVAHAQAPQPQRRAGGRVPGILGQVRLRREERVPLHQQDERFGFRGSRARTPVRAVGFAGRRAGGTARDGDERHARRGRAKRPDHPAAIFCVIFCSRSSSTLTS